MAYLTYRGHGLGLSVVGLMGVKSTSLEHRLVHNSLVNVGTQGIEEMNFLNFPP